MSKKYKAQKYDKYTFLFAIEEETGLPHIFQRRGLEYIDAINTFMTVDKKVFNLIYRRWEAYSPETKLGIYYAEVEVSTTILVMSLFEPDTTFCKKFKIKK